MGSYLSGLQQGVKATGVLSCNTGAAPQTNAGPTLAMNDVSAGTLAALVYMQANVNTMTLEAQWQVSKNGTTWYDAKPTNNAATVVAVTGTGSPVSTTIAVSAPDAVYGFPFSRCSVISRVAAAVDANDQYSVEYEYLKRGYAV